MDIPVHLFDFWQKFAVTRVSDPTKNFYEAFSFDDDEASANELAALVLAGRKQATASLLWSYEKDQKPLPKAGDFSIVTSFSGLPVCIIETLRIVIVPFQDVSEDFAAAEAEGDGSLAYWRAAHEAFFGRECKHIGRIPHASMPVVCERFAVVFPERVSHTASLQ